MEELRALVLELMELTSAQRRRIAEQEARIAELQRRLGADSSSSHQPPSTDSPFRKPPPRSSRRSSGRRPSKQPGQPGTTMPLVDEPDEVITLDPACCRRCGADLSGARVRSVSRRQVTDVPPPPAPRVTEYRIVTRSCPGCDTATAADAPAVAPARAQYGPRVLARAVELVCAHYLPVGRAATLLRSMLGVPISTGFCAGVRARAARLLEHTFLPRVRELLRGVAVLHADETLSGSRSRS